MQTVDTIIDARWVIPVDEQDSIFDNHAVVINNGIIADLGCTSVIDAQYRGISRVTLKNHALLPGFVNAHTHAAMALLRGIGEDVPLSVWLNEHIWPTESKFMSPQFVEDGTKLAIAEMVRSGTTCFADMYFFPNRVGEIAERLKMRACMGMIVIDFPSPWASSPAEYLSKGMNLHDQFAGSELISTAWAPHSPYTVSGDTLKEVARLADEMSTPIHMHVNETAEEVKNSMIEVDASPIERLGEFGLIQSKLMAVHATALTDQEIEQFANAGVSVIHCPKSNMKLASGTCRVAELLEADVNVAIGTDGAASNNSLNMIEEMRFASLLAKVTTRDATVVNGCQAIRMATINGARALGIDNVTGSLEIGKFADLCAINLSELEVTPVYNCITQIVHSASRNLVTDVWVGGNQILKNQKLTELDEDEISELAESWQQKIQKSSSE